MSVGFLINPIDIVYSRQVADALLPSDSRRGYKSFFDGLLKVCEERVQYRGAAASGLAYGLLFASMSNLYDFLKEYYFFFFGAATWLRPAVLLPVTFVGAFVFLPFDNVKVRLHTMFSLPDGRSPYDGAFDCFKKILKYECNYEKYSSFLAFHNGGVAYFLKLYISLLIGVYGSDIAFRYNYQEGDLIESGTYYKSHYAKLIPHEPWTREEVNKKTLDLEPTTEFYTDYSKNSSFKV